MIRAHRRSRRPTRHGFALLVVLVIVALLALSAYTFSDLMVTENQSAQLHGQQLQARALVDSGVAHIRYFLELDDLTRQDLGGTYHNPQQFQGQLVIDHVSPVGRGRFTIVASEQDSMGYLGGSRFGLEDESSRLNINALTLETDAGAGSSAGGGTGGGGTGGGGTGGGGTGGGGTGGGGTGGGGTGGGGTGGGGTGGGGTGGGGTGGGGTGGGGTGGDSAAAVASLLGASGQALLMKLPGMTEDVADAILDWIDTDDEPREYGAEIDYYSSLSPPYAPRNGPLQSVEELLLVRGVTPAMLFGRDINRNGMIDVHEQELPLMLDVDPGDGSMDCGWSSYLTLYSMEKNASSDGQPRINLNGDDMQQLHEDLSAVDTAWATFIVAYRQSGAYQGNSQQTEPAGGQALDLTRQGSNQLNQVLDLIGVRVEAQLENGQKVVLESPFAEDPLSMTGYLPKLMDMCTIQSEKQIPGRININQASRTVLLAIPGMTSDMVESILSQRNAAESEIDTEYQHETWLLTRGIVTLDEMRALLPFVTAGGDVYRAQVIGYFDQGEVSSRAEVVIDATRALPRVLLWRDISHLGRGYARETLGVDTLSR